MDASGPSGKQIELVGDDVELAAQLHYGFLPGGFENDEVDIAVKMLPHREIGGDYCSVLPIDRKRVLVCVCDVMGHGIASALIAARVNTFVLTCAFRQPEPWIVVETLNQFLCDHLPRVGMFVTFFALLLDFERGEMDFAGAGHPPAIFYEAASGESGLLESKAAVLGVRHPLPTKCCREVKPLGDGDRIVLYTDGLFESRDAEGKEFGLERLLALARELPDLASVEFGDRLFDAVRRHAGDRIEDDLLALTVRIK